MRSEEAIAAREADDVPVLDWSCFDELCGSGAATPLEITEVFSTQVSPSLQEMALARRDRERLAFAAHKLRGGAPTLGFRRMGELADRIEAEARRRTS